MSEQAWSEAEVGELLLGLRELRASSERKIRNNQRKLRMWTERDEAANPGFREFLHTSLAQHEARLERIAALIPKVKHLGPAQPFWRERRTQP